MSETQATPEAKASKKETVYEKVTMTDGRVVEFAGTRQTDKTILPTTPALPSACASTSATARPAA